MIRSLLVILLLFASFGAYAQHHDFQSLYMYDGLTINPAYAGNKGALVLNANYRDQWAGIKGAPQTFSFTTHLITKSKKNGLGLIVLNDKYGINNNLKVNAVYSYKLNFRKSILSFGIAGGIREESIDRNALNLLDATDASFMNLPERKLVPDVNFGVMYKRKNFLAGISIPNLVRTNAATTDQAANLYAGNLISINRDLKLKPSILVRYIKNSPLSYEGNLTLYYGDKLSGGAGLRNDKSCNLHLRLQLNRQFGIAYLYERNLGQFNAFLKNTHEFMLNYTFDYKSNVQSPRYF